MSMLKYCRVQVDHGICSGPTPDNFRQLFLHQEVRLEHVKHEIRDKTSESDHMKAVSTEALLNLDE